MAIATAVYVDGYNFYYGRIRSTPYKWLDLVSLFESLLKRQRPGSELLHLNYFGAPALGRFATHGEESVVAQQNYIRALEWLHPTRFMKTMGRHSVDRGGTLLPAFLLGKSYDRTQRVRVWKLEEKQTDVNLALAMYMDAASGCYQQLVVCSNDSDLEPVMRAIKDHFPTIMLGVVTPMHPPEHGRDGGRRLSISLEKQADWIRAHLLDEELQCAQLPEKIHTGKKPIRKPAHW
ncbi:NYN domain-containing protein [Pseudomonas aeruginosa]|nr:NYN domain-containing protein [Pseudomonas aeruginosa]